MRIERARAKPARVTPWVEADSGINGTGTDTVEGGNMRLDLLALPDLVDTPLIEVQYTQQRTAGSGELRTWVRLINKTLTSVVTEPNPDGNQDFGAVQAGGVARNRRVLIKLNVLQFRGALIGDDALDIRVRASGTASDTQWSVTGMRARLIYAPL